MTKIHVVTSTNRHLYEREIDSYHRARHKVFIDELKWPDLVSRQDGREYDQFDRDGAVYLLAIEDSEVVGGIRLLRTTAPHLLSEIFPHLATIRAIPRGARVAESTRFFVVPEYRRRGEGLKIADVLVAAMMDYALREGLSAISLVLDTYWLPKFRAYGWAFQPLGEQQLPHGERIVAITIDVTPAALSGIRGSCRLPHRSALTWRGEITPFITGGPRYHPTAATGSERSGSTPIWSA